MSKSEVMDLTTSCQSFPELPIPLIQRDNVLDAIDTIFEGSTQLVVIEGIEEIGKTILLAQFAKRHPNQAFSLFIPPIGRWAYGPSFLTLDLCNQLEWALYKRELTAENISDTLLRNNLFEIQKRARRTRTLYYFIVDGLHHIPPEDLQTRDLILDMLPLGGYAGFRFLFSGDINSLPLNLQANVSHKSYLVSGFILDETVRYLDDLNINRQHIEELHKVLRGIPGYLASARRLIHGGTDAQTLLNEMPGKLSNVFELEWRKVNVQDDTSQSLLAIIASDNRKYSIQELARILNLQVANIRNLLSPLRFLEIDVQNDKVSFVSETFRRLAAERLQSRRNFIADILINDLLTNPESTDALAYLPNYFEQSGRLEELLNYLSPKHLSKIIEQSQSLVPSKLTMDLGVEAARQLHRDGDLLRFSMQKSTVTQLAGAEIGRSEIEARMALNDYQGALTLAQSTILKEERLHLLAAVARIKAEQGLVVEPALTSQIHQLYTQIDFSALGKQAIDIASDLIYSDAHLAINLIDKVKNIATNEGSLDWDFAKLSAAALGSNKDLLENQGIFDNVRERIKDPEARRFITAAYFRYKEYSAMSIIAEAQTFENIKDSLYLLRLWAVNNRDKSDAAEVVDYALKAMITTTTYIPTARDFRELATPLPHILDEAKARHLVGRFESQKGVIHSLGITEEFVRLQLLLARVECRYDLEAARNRLIETYFDISEIKDLVLKTVCLARLVAWMAIMDPKVVLENKDRVLIETELKDDIQLLLDGTSDQYEATKDVIQALVKARPDMALIISKSLNTEARRNKSFGYVIETALRVPVSKLNVKFLIDIIDEITDTRSKGEAIFTIIKHMAMEKEPIDHLIGAMLPLINRIREIGDLIKQCQAYSLSYNLLLKYDPITYSDFASHLLSTLQRSWESIDTGWVRVNVCFQIAKTIAESSLDTARNYLDLAEKCKEEVVLDASSSAISYEVCLYLAIRIFNGLLAKRLDTPQDLENLDKFINWLPSYGEQAQLWAEVATCFYTNRRLNDCHRIVTEHVKPLLRNISTLDRVVRENVIIYIAPALYFTHKRTALEQIMELSRPARDAAYAYICRLILCKQSLVNPYENALGQGFDISYEEIVDICELIDLIDEDQTIYSLITAIADSVSLRRRQDRFSPLQKQDIARRLSELVNRKLPNERHIRHNGFKIAAQTQVARILRTTKVQDWLDLANEALTIPNLADRAYVLTIIASALPSKEGERRRQIFEEVLQICKKVPVDIEKMRLYETVALLTLEIDAALSKECLNLAMKATANDDDTKINSIRRRIIDFSQKLDRSLTLAKSLVNIIEIELIKENLTRWIQTLSLKKDFMDHPNDVNDNLMTSPDLPQIATKLLGSLNANRITPVPIENVRDLVQAAANFPLFKSYTILAWAVQNVVKRYSQTDQALAYLRPMYQASLMSAELASAIVTHSAIKLKSSRDYTSDSSNDSNVLIRSRDREAALRVLLNWFTDDLKDYLKICDPYFGPEDLEVLQLIRSVKPGCQIHILTSKRHQDQEGIGSSYEEAYRNYWHLHISEQNPPDTEIVIVGTENKGDLPIHDRWWLTRGGGFLMGTSFNSLGIGKDSEITILSKEHAEVLEDEIDQYLQRTKRDHRGERLRYSIFTL